MATELQNVCDGFAKTYEENRGRFDMSKVLDSFYALLPEKPGRLLDLGCGAGEPVSKYFVDRDWSVTGVDFSKNMLELAAKYVPEMNTQHGNISEVSFEPNQFNAITASYSLFHIPSEKHEALFQNFYQWLQPQGKALFTYATHEYTGSHEFNGYKNFLGHELFYSHKNPGQLFKDLKNIGFTVEDAQFREIGGETFLWVTVGR